MTTKINQEPNGTKPATEINAAKHILSNRNLQLYFPGQFISMLGTWTQQMAMSWLIYRMTDSSAMLGLVGFTSQVPTLILTPFAGIVIDRVNRHRLLITTQMLSMIQAGLLATLVFTGHVQLWQLFILSAALGMISAFDLPTRQTFMVDMLEHNDQLRSAIAINSSINTLTRLVGPCIAGLFIAWAGEGMCFLVNALSYIAVIVALLCVKARQSQSNKEKQHPFTQLKEGFAYTFGFLPIRSLIIFLALISLFSIPYNILMPAFAKDIFHGDASTLGFLSAAAGLGAVVGALFTGSHKNVEKLGQWIIAGCILFGVSLIIFGFSKSFILSLCMLTLVGFGSMVLLTGSSTLVQTLVDEDKRGRVMSILIMAFLGPSPFGCMAAGWLASSIGAGNTVIILGVITLILAFAFFSQIGKIEAVQT